MKALITSHNPELDMQQVIVLDFTRGNMARCQLSDASGTFDMSVNDLTIQCPVCDGSVEQKIHAEYTGRYGNGGIPEEEVHEVLICTDCETVVALDWEVVK